MKHTNTSTAKTEIAKADATTVAATTTDSRTDERMQIPLHQLSLYIHNVRKQAPSGIAELADNIAAAELLQNLLVHPLMNRKKVAGYGVVAGLRRLLALQLLCE